MIHARNLKEVSHPIIESVPSKPWIPVTLDEFRDQFGDGIVNRLASAIFSRNRSGNLNPVLHEWGAPELNPKVTEKADPEVEKEVKRRFDAKVLMTGSQIKRSVFMGLQGSVTKLDQVDTSDSYLKKMLLDLIANDFMSELRPTDIEIPDLLERGSVIKQQLNDWEKGIEPVRLVSKTAGKWVDSHSLVVAIS